MKISIFGLGYVGAVSFGGLTRLGHEVIGVDVDPVKLAIFEAGKSPIVEAGMDQLIAEAMNSGRSRVTSDATRAITDTDVSFVCVGTPSDRTGAHDLGALKKVCQQIGEAISAKQTHHTVVIRSTVTPGTTNDQLGPVLEQACGRPRGGAFSLCFQPEFLREGVSIRDFENPAVTIVGGDPIGVEIVRSIFEPLPGEHFESSIESAEMVKFCSNAFHALKVTFANEVGRLCKGLSVNGSEVMSLLCADKQLNASAAYLKPGYAFGGSCLPKDLRALVSMSQRIGAELPMLREVLPSNDAHLKHALELVLETNSRKIALIGVSFKGGTDDLRESPLLELAERLIGKGIDVQIFDPEVNLSRLIGSNKAFVENRIPHIATLMVDDCRVAIEAAEVVVFGVRDPDAEQAIADGCAAHATVIDLVGLPDTVARGSTRVEGICW